MVWLLRVFNYFGWSLITWNVLKIIQREYGFSAKRLDNRLLARTVREALRAGGNKYDAAARVIAVHALDPEQRARLPDVEWMEFIPQTMRRVTHMGNPDVALADVEAILATELGDDG